MSITINFQYEYEEYREGLEQLQRLAANEAPRQGRSTVVLNWAFFIGLGITLFVLLSRRGAPSPAASPPRSGVDLASGMVALAVGTVLLFVVLRALGLRPRSLRKLFDETPGMHRRRSITFDEQGVTDCDGFTTNRTLWAGYVRFEESDEFLFLFTSPRMALFIPKRAFPNAESLAARGKSRPEVLETAFSTPPERVKMAESDFCHGLLGEARRTARSNISATTSAFRVIPSKGE